MIIDAVVPAHNEALTVGDVVRALIASGVFRRVVVVDDGSVDTTAEAAGSAGAQVLRLAPNRGKAEAMLAGVGASDADAFGFFDADLLGLKPVHIQELHDHLLFGFDMVCGLQDYGWKNALQLVTPLMTGQRFVLRWILEELPATCWSGYAIETAMNFIADKHGASTCVVPLAGLGVRLKQAKVGTVSGWLGHLRMALQMARARAELERTGGLACSPAGRGAGPR